MKVSKTSSKFSNVARCDSVYNGNIKGTRTYVDGVRALRLQKWGLRECTLRPDGAGGYIIMFYKTDILHYYADGYIGVDAAGYYTPTTFQRLYDACGLRLQTIAKSASITDQTTRICVETPREGGGKFNSSIPFFNGIRIHGDTHEVHPGDSVDLPSERRAEQKKVSKLAQKNFKPLWARLGPRIKLSINLGVWVDAAMKGRKSPNSSFSVSRALPHEIRPETQLQNLIDDPSYAPTDDELHDMVVGVGKSMWFYNPTEENIRAAYRGKVETPRKSLQWTYAESIGGIETHGGEILGNGYYVNPKDEQAVK